MAAPSSTSIANRALQMLGANTILALTDATREARAMNTCYDSCRRAELRAHTWNFAKKRSVLAPDASGPAFGYTYQFSLPTDCLRVPLPRDATLDWVEEGGKLLTNTLQSPYLGVPTTTSSSGAQLSLVYIADITDCTKFDALFLEALAARMALACVDQITQSNTKKEEVRKDYLAIIQEARKVNAMENLPAEPVDDPWLLGRL